ncbi:MAG: Zn-dependent hydrolase, partial [Flammeovirgaceae bacterium]|nr:Zn-dependent hydrolase [Flammeovirgaceae bacterium]
MISCTGNQNTKQEEDIEVIAEPEDLIRPEIYASVALQTDLSKLSENEKKLIPILIEAAKVMDDLFWQQAYGEKTTLLNSISDARTKKFVEINYGPWDRLKDNKPFIEGVGEKPKGANFYPWDMSEEDYQNFKEESKGSLYTIISKTEDGSLRSIPYNEYYAEALEKAAKLLKQAAEMTENTEFKKYLNLRAKALLSNEYDESDIAWMEMRTNGIDVIIGPIENYEDQLFGYKAAFEAYVLVKDKEWSERLEKYAALLPELQKGLPVDDIYKQ